MEVIDMKQKHIDASREVRLWLRDLIVPTVVIVAAVMSKPEIRESASNKIKNVKSSIKNKFKKEN